MAKKPAKTTKTRTPEQQGALVERMVKRLLDGEAVYLIPGQGGEAEAFLTDRARLTASIEHLRATVERAENRAKYAEERERVTAAETTRLLEAESERKKAASRLIAPPSFDGYAALPLGTCNGCGGQAILVLSSSPYMLCPHEGPKGTLLGLDVIALDPKLVKKARDVLLGLVRAEAVKPAPMIISPPGADKAQAALSKIAEVARSGLGSS
jgi:hypothetical protein